MPMCAHAGRVHPNKITLSVCQVHRARASINHRTQAGQRFTTMHQEPELLSDVAGNSGQRSAAVDMFHDGFFTGPDASSEFAPMSMGSVPSIASLLRHRTQPDGRVLQHGPSSTLDLATAFSSSPSSAQANSELPSYNTHGTAGQHATFTVTHGQHTADQPHSYTMNHDHNTAAQPTNFAMTTNHQTPSQPASFTMTTDHDAAGQPTSFTMTTNNHTANQPTTVVMADNLRQNTPFLTTQMGSIATLEPHLNLIDGGGLFNAWSRPAPVAQLLASPTHGALALSMQAPTPRQIADPLLQQPGFPAHASPDPFRLPRLSQDPLSPTQSAAHQQLWHLCGGAQQRPPRQLSSGQMQPPANSTAETGMRLLGLEPWPSSDMMGPPSLTDAGAARQAWLDWQVTSNSDGVRGRSLTSQSMPLSDLTGLLSGQGISALQDQQPSVSQMALPSPPPPIYCSNCTMPVDDQPPLCTQTSSSPNRLPLVCPHCNQPVVPSQGALQPWPAVTAGTKPTVACAAEPAPAPATQATPAEAALGQAAQSAEQRQSPSSPGPTAMAVTSGPPLAEAWNASGTLLAYDERMLAHSEPPSRWGREHPERPARLVAIMQQLSSSGLLERCQQVSGRPATDEELAAVHDPELIKQVAAASAAAGAAAAAARKAAATAGSTDKEGDAPNEAPSALDTLRSASSAETTRWVVDCPMNESTNDCARIAAGSAIDVAVAAFTRRNGTRNGAAIIRPPGHHAESALSMGFCIFNNAAVAARAAQKAGARRVLILDWDVHHGNGTAHAFYEDPSVLFISTHRWDRGHFFPGTGGPREAGAGTGVGHTVNVAWNGPGKTDQDCLLAFRHVVMPIASAYAPDLVIVSAGFDAAAGDPLGECLLSPALYGHLTHMLSSLAPCVLLLEGGYNLSVTAACTAECVRVLLGGQPADLPQPGDGNASVSGMDAVLQTLSVHAPYWPAAREQLEVLQERQELLREQQELMRQQQAAEAESDTDLFGGLLDDRLLSITQLDLESDGMLDCPRDRE